MTLQRVEEHFPHRESGGKGGASAARIPNLETETFSCRNTTQQQTSTQGIAQEILIYLEHSITINCSSFTKRLDLGR
jgi:hypothetical protein